MASDGCAGSSPASSTAKSLCKSSIYGGFFYAYSPRYCQHSYHYLLLFRGVLHRLCKPEFTMKATVNVLCYRSKTLSNGEHPLMICVCKNRKRLPIVSTIQICKSISLILIILTIGTDSQMQYNFFISTIISVPLKFGSSFVTY